MDETVKKKYKDSRKNKLGFFSSVAESIKTRKAKLSIDAFNNPDLGWELAKIKNENVENKLSIDLSNVSAKHILSERESILAFELNKKIDELENKDENNVLSQLKGRGIEEIGI